jgi:hypothetical protein
MVNPVRLYVARALDGAIGPQGLRHRPARALGFFRLCKSVHRLRDAP